MLVYDLRIVSKADKIYSSYNVFAAHKLTLAECFFPFRNKKINIARILMYFVTNTTELRFRAQKIGFIGGSNIVMIMMSFGRIKIRLAHFHIE